MRTIDQLEKVTSAEDEALLVLNNAAATNTNAMTFSDLKSQILKGNADSATKAVSADSATEAGKATNDANGNKIDTTYAPIASPVFTGTPKVPTPNGDSVDTQAANKKYVNDSITSAVSAAKTEVKNGNVASATNDSDGNPINTTYAKLVSPSFSGAPTVPTPDNSSDGTQAANKKYVNDQITSAVSTATTSIQNGNVASATKATNDANGNKIDTTYAPIASPEFSGTPKVPTPDGDSVDTQATNKKYVNDQITEAVSAAKTEVKSGNVNSATNDAKGNKIDTTYAPIASPTFTGTPAVPTPDNSSADAQATNKKYVNARITEAIGNVIQFKVNKVDALPAADVAEANTIYFAPADNTDDDNVYNEFILIDGKWEQIGSSVVKLPVASAVDATNATNDSDGNKINTTYAKLVSPSFTGAPTVPTPNGDSADIQAANKKYVNDQITSAVSAAKTEVKNGNVASATNATRATNDANGNKIDTTYAPIASPAFSGAPTVPTPDGNSVDTQAANKKYVNDQITSAVSAAKTSIQGGNVSSATNATNATNDSDGNKINTTYAKLVSPSFSGAPKVPTPTGDSDGTQAANKKYVNDQITSAVSAAKTEVKSGNVNSATNAANATKATNDANGSRIDTTYAKLASPAFTGAPTVPTPTSDSVDGQVTNKKYVNDQITSAVSAAKSAIQNGNVASATNAANATKATNDSDGNKISTTYAKLVSPSFTGAPTVPTPDSKSDGTQAANKKYVNDSVAAAKSAIQNGNVASANHAASATNATNATNAANATKATNDSDGNKISTTYAKLTSPAFTGAPTVPTPDSKSVDTQAANKKYVNDSISTAKSAIQNGNVASANHAASATNATNATNAANATKATNDANGSRIDTTYAKLVSPSFSGSPAVPTPDGNSADVQAANKKYVNDRITQAIGNIIQFKVTKVSALPATNAGKANTIYFVPASTTAGNNIYNEFMLIDGKWEQIGSSVVNMPGSLPASGVANEAVMDFGDLDS